MTETVCIHCLRPVHQTERGLADDTRDPYFCPKARSLAHATERVCAGCGYLPSENHGPEGCPAL